MAKMKKTQETPQSNEAAEVLAAAGRSRVLVMIDERGRDRRIACDLTSSLQGLSIPCPKCDGEADLLIISKHGHSHNGVACEYECSACRAHGTLYES